ncbi:MAG: VWA domain-containing protein [Desulfobacterales bacterium]|nr:VWA domain-containing protein [Desulfobacterales bacterium]
MRKILLAATVFFLIAAPALAAEDVMVVFDGSNSMWGQIEGTAKIEIAREAMHSLIGDWTEGTNIGLMAYGHRREGDCEDIETLIEPGPFDREHFFSTIENITPRGKTPLTASIEQAAETLAYRDNPATVIVITDGIETCQRDPCALADDLERMGVDFTAHVVGFDLKDEEQEAVACIAERTGGRFLPAGDAAELRTALSEVGTAVAEPEPEPEPEVEVSAPESAATGASFPVSWVGTIHHSDFVAIVPMGADDDELGNYKRVRNNNETELRAPSEPGLYEVRYVLDEGRKALAATEIEITEPEVEVNAPESATTGSSFPVSWAGAIHRSDFIAIVPMGADDDELGNHKRVRNNNETELRAPSEPGLYEVRYVLDEGRKPLASTEIEITEPEVEVSAPESTTTGSSFPVSWVGTIHHSDFVAIVPMGADDDELGNHKRVRNNNETELRAPSEPGLYEVRYVLDEGRKPLASTEIEITEPGIELSGPDKARAGSELRVSWRGKPPHRSDFIAIVPMGADDDELGNHKRVGNNSEIDLEAPEQTGLYEVRYVLDEGRRTLARHSVEVVDETAALDTGGSLDVTETAAAGDTIEVNWSADTESGDLRIALAQTDQAKFTWIEVQSASDGPPLTFTLPEEPGQYEFRLLDIPGRKVLSRSIIDVQ